MDQTHYIHRFEYGRLNGENYSPAGLTASALEQFLYIVCCLELNREGASPSLKSARAPPRRRMPTHTSPWKRPATTRESGRADITFSPPLLQASRLQGNSLHHVFPVFELRPRRLSTNSHPVPWPFCEHSLRRAHKSGHCSASCCLRSTFIILLLLLDSSTVRDTVLRRHLTKGPRVSLKASRAPRLLLCLACSFARLNLRALFVAWSIQRPRPLLGRKLHLSSQHRLGQR